MAAGPTIASIGNANIDFSYKLKRLPLSDTVIPAEGYVIGTGGSASNYAYAARRLGAVAKFYGAVADDILGKYFINELERLGVDVSGVQVVEREHTGTVSLWIDEKGEKHGVAWRGANLRLTPKAEWSELGSADLIHLAGCSPEVTSWVVSHKHRILTLDPGSASGLYSAAELYRMLSGSSIAYLSEREVRSLAEFRGESPGAMARSSGCTIVEKMGSAGVKVFSKGGDFEMRALPVQAVDATAAGDVFAAAFDISVLTTKDIHVAASWATAAAALKVAHAGAKSGAPSYEKVWKLVHSSEEQLRPKPL